MHPSEREKVSDFVAASSVDSKGSSIWAIFLLPSQALELDWEQSSYSLDWHSDVGCQDWIAMLLLLVSTFNIFNTQTFVLLRIKNMDV